MDMIYIHIIITIIVAIIAAYTTHLFALRREHKNWKRTLELLKIQEYNKAAAIFRSVFSKTLRKLKQEYDKSCFEIIREFIEQQEVATIQFKSYLSGEEMDKLDAAWKEYAGSNKNSPDRIDLNIYNTKDVNVCDYKDKDEWRQAIQRKEKGLRKDARTKIGTAPILDVNEVTSPLDIFKNFKNYNFSIFIPTPK
jgi:hypothetical protein